MRLSVCCLIVFLVTRAASAGPPTLRELRPWGAERGQSLTLTLVGDSLSGDAEIFSALPGSLETPMASDGLLTLKVQLRPDAPVGVYPIRIRTPGGLSNALFFSVGDLPELHETEPNDLMPSPSVLSSASADRSASHAPITLPATVNGQLTGTDQDVFRVTGKKGERLVAEVEAQRIGSTLDPTIRLLSGAGRELAIAEDTPGLGLDCRIDLTFPEDGDYFVVVHDTKYAGLPTGQYRLKIGSLDYAETIFPLGAERGREVEVTLSGGSLTKPVVSKVVPASLPETRHALVPWPASFRNSRLPFRFAISEMPEWVEPASDDAAERVFDSPKLLNGRLAKPAEVDRYKFRVQPGESWVFEVEAASLGSRLDGLLTVLNAQSQVLASADDGNGLDPRVQVQVPAGVSEITVSLEDLHGRGGPGFEYRLAARHAQPNFSLQVMQPVVNIPRNGTAVVPVQAQRSGYSGPIQLSIPEHRAGVRAEFGLIAENANDGLLVLSADPQAELGAFDLEIVGQGGPPTKPMRRPAVAVGRNPYAMVDALPARVPAAVSETPPVQFTVAERSIRILHGHSRTLKLTAVRSPEASDVIAITGSGVPFPTVEGTAGTIAKESTEVVLNLKGSPEVPQVGPFTLQLTAKTKVGGRDETIQLPPVRLEVARPFAIELLTPTIELAVGQRAAVQIVVRRESPFEGIVALGPAGSLPQHVSLSQREVTKGQVFAELEMAVGEAATPGEITIPLRAATPMEGRKGDKDYVIPDTPIRIKIGAKDAKQTQVQPDAPSDIASVR